HPPSGATGPIADPSHEGSVAGMPLRKERVRRREVAAVGASPKLHAGVGGEDRAAGRRIVAAAIGHEAVLRALKGGDGGGLGDAGATRVLEPGWESSGDRGDRR